MPRVRLDLSEGYMDVTLDDNADQETVEALRAVGEAGLRWLKANDVARAWAYGRAWHERPEYSFACACIGPMPGQTECHCAAEARRRGTPWDAVT